MSCDTIVLRILASALLALSGCADTSTSALSLPSPDGHQFVDDVYPVLLRDCAFSSCHGSEDRFLRIVGPGRPRLDPSMTEPTDPMSYDEVLLSYDRARSLLATAGPVTESLLLTKPLEFSAGGQGHRGADDYGRNVYASTTAPGLVTLLRWANTFGPPPSQDDVDAAIERAGEAQVEFDDHFSSTLADQL